MNMERRPAPSSPEDSGNLPLKDLVKTVFRCCYCEITHEKDKMGCLSCGHTGCYACLQKWLEQPGRAKDCPQCRQVDVRLYRLQLDPEIKPRKDGPGPSTQWSKRLVAWSTLYKLTAKVIGGVDKMDPATPSSSVERTPREIAQLVEVLEDVNVEIQSQLVARMVDFDERIAPCFRTLEDQRRRLSEQDASIKQLQNQLAAAKSSAAKEKIHATKFKDELSKLKSRNVKLQRQCDATTALAEHANASIVALNETVGAQQARIKTLEERTGEDQKKLLQRKKLQAEVADLKRQLAGSEHKRRRESTDAETSELLVLPPGGDQIPRESRPRLEVTNPFARHSESTQARSGARIAPSPGAEDVSHAPRAKRPRLGAVIPFSYERLWGSSPRARSEARPTFSGGSKAANQLAKFGTPRAPVTKQNTGRPGPSTR